MRIETLSFLVLGTIVVSCMDEGVARKPEPAKIGMPTPAEPSQGLTL